MEYRQTKIINKIQIFRPNKYKLLLLLFLNYLFLYIDTFPWITWVKFGWNIFKMGVLAVIFRTSPCLFQMEHIYIWWNYCIFRDIQVRIVVTYLITESKRFIYIQVSILKRTSAASETISFQEIFEHMFWVEFLIEKT